MGERLMHVPRVSDGVDLQRALMSCSLLDGDRLSYRALDVEQIGSVYEAMMGFAIEMVTEPSIGLRGKRKPGAPPADAVVGLQSLLAMKGAERLKALDETGIDVSGKTATAIKEAATHDELVAALGKKISPYTPEVVPRGSMVLQPTEERRRSGSHYTPRALTEPIVATTPRPLLEAMGENPTPEQILALKICDPAMGSGAFLVAACRALGDRLVSAWQRHKRLESVKGQPPSVQSHPTKTRSLHARRVVAQRCLYGVDKNPFAVDLAKLSPVARDARQRSSIHVSRSRASTRRFARRTLARTNRQFSLGTAEKETARRSYTQRRRCTSARPGASTQIHELGTPTTRARNSACCATLRIH